MKFKVEYHPDFFNDIAQAVDWYNKKRAGLGDRLFNSIKNAKSIKTLFYPFRLLNLQHQVKIRLFITF